MRSLPPPNVHSVPLGELDADLPLPPAVLSWYAIESAVSGQLVSSACYGFSVSPSSWETAASWELCTLEDLSQD